MLEWLFVQGCFAISNSPKACRVSSGEYLKEDAMKSDERWKLAQDTWSKIEMAVNVSILQ